MFSRLLAAPPETDTVMLVAGLEGDDTPLGEAIGELSAAARSIQPEEIQVEYQELFIGIGRGELVPYGSFYLTGFLMEKPLAKLRQDMARLGIERAPDVREPEDHIASVCEMMAGLIDGGFGAGADIDEQAAFFDRHVEPWAGRFFEDLETAGSARFYKPLGALGKLFLSIESAALKMAA